MSTHAAPAKSAKTVPFIERHYFLLRRLHSLSGVAPIGLFLFPHLTTNSSIVWGSTLNKGKFGDVVAQYGSDAAGVATFQHEVDFIHNLPALVFVEIFVLWLPIAFHAILGVYFARTGKSNVDRYAYQGNYRYWLQRMTGYVGVAFIFAHVSSLRWGWTYGGLLPTFDAAHAASSTASTRPVTEVGIDRLVIVPSPTPPLRLKPQQRTAPVLSRNSSTPDSDT